MGGRKKDIEPVTERHRAGGNKKPTGRFDEQLQRQPPAAERPTANMIACGYPETQNIRQVALKTK